MLPRHSRGQAQCLHDRLHSAHALGVDIHRPKDGLHSVGHGRRRHNGLSPTEMDQDTYIVGGSLYTQVLIRTDTLTHTIETD